MTKILITISILCLGIGWGCALAEDDTQTPPLQQELAQLATKLKKPQPTTATEPQTAPTTQPTDTQPQAAPTPTSTISEQAFADVVTSKLPLSPEQIAVLYKAFTQARKAASTPPGVPPRPSISSIMINLSPNATPPIIRLESGYITTLVFVDATGQPWPIEYYSIGDPLAFNIPANTVNIKGGDNNILAIQAKSYYKRSNLVVHLKDLDTPIVATLLTGQKAVDYRVDLRIPGVGPNAILEQEGLPSPANPLLLNALNGVPPSKQARTLTAAGDPLTKAWLLNNKLYIRTQLDIISPGWTAKMSSIDGTHVYELNPTPMILAVAHNDNKNGQGDKLIKLYLKNTKD